MLTPLQVQWQNTFRNHDLWWAWLTKSNRKCLIKWDLSLINTKQSIMKDFHRLIQCMVCHCEKQHTPGCGCLSVAFIERAQNNFHLSSQTVNLHKSLLKIWKCCLGMHVKNMSGMEGSARFMHQKCALVVSVKMMQISSVMERIYHKRQILKCSMHSLA